MPNVPGTTPVIIGVGEVKNVSTKPQDALEPLQLILQAVQRAVGDTNLPASAADQLRSSIDSISVVRTWTWLYDDLPALVAKELGVQPKHTFYSEHGGNSPALLCDEAARRIALGHSKLAIIAGGEALASLSSCAAAKQFPPSGWTKPAGDITSVFSPTTMQLPKDLGGVHGLGHPVQVYPMYENAFRAHIGQTISANHEESAKMYAEFAQIAARRPSAWNYGKPPPTQVDIATVSPKNRMICFPYPLLMNAFNNVNLSTACILASAEFATQLGIPQERWVYPIGGAGTADSDQCWDRPNFYSSPSISTSIDTALRVAQLDQSQIDIFDFYSCFPIVPKIACAHVGLPVINPPKPITVLGGLTSFGGAGNNYSMHAIIEVVRRLRRREGENGLVLANGGVLSYQHVVVLSTQPRKSPYPHLPPLPKMLDVPGPSIDGHPEGLATIEAYTVDFNRDGTPKRAYIIGRLEHNGRRFVANHGDRMTLRQLASWDEEPVGKNGWVSMEGARNVFRLDAGKL
ncbi:thiolase, partial [Auricularia subglabra TFB-10046 SS5]